MKEALKGMKKEKPKDKMLELQLESQMDMM
jgi:hypothetical protein